MSKKRFSKKGFEKLESNFQLVEMLLETSRKKVKKLQKELVDLQSHRGCIEIEKRENKNLQETFYRQRKSLCDRDIARLETQLEILQAESLGFGICFKRCYYLMYGKPDLKST